MERRARLLVLIGAAATLAVAAASPAGAKLYMTRDDALARVFGSGARFEPRAAFLTTAQVDSVRTHAQAPFDTPRLTYWVATRGDSLLGHAYLDTHPVRTMPATLLVAVGPDGRVRAVEVLAFHEPEDYLPPRRWLQRLLGQTLSPHLRAGDGVDGITGATLSARAFTETVRRCLALDRMFQGSGH